MTKYNKSLIMSRAWVLVKTCKISISTALKAAWATAKAENAAKQAGKDSGWNYKVISNDWAKGAYNRTYISARIYTNAWNLKREIKIGYIDNLTGALVA